MKKLFTILTLIAFAGLAAGCNTIHGMGQDIQTAGEKIEKASKK